MGQLFIPSNHRELKVIIMATWIKSDTQGVRYRKHRSRKHGVRFDRYFAMRYRVDGKLKEEALGWSTEGWTEKKLAAVLAEIKANITKGEGPRSLQEKRDIQAQATIDEEEEKIATRRASLSFSDLWPRYLEYSKNNKRTVKSWQREQQLYNNHILQVIGKLPLIKVSQIHLERIKKNMSRKGLANRTIRYALDVVRQVYNFGIHQDFYVGVNPAAKGKVKRPQEDNRKDRYLTREEAEILLFELRKRSKDTHDISLLSLYSGMRFGEIANLKWGNVDFSQEQIMLKKTKTATNRAAYMTPDIKAMLLARQKGGPEDLVFPARRIVNTPKKRISRAYYDTVSHLFNKNIDDKKERVDFHTLRHTFASWLMEDGTNIYYVKDLLGHSTVKTTERYAHVGQNEKREAVLRLQK